MVINTSGRWRKRVAATLLVLMVFIMAATVPAAGQTRPTLYWGRTGQSVHLVQWKLQQWGYYKGNIDGVYGAKTVQAVRFFQRRNGLKVDGVVGPQTWAALGFPVAPAGAARPAATYRGASGVARNDDVGLLSRVVMGEAAGEPFEGQVAVAAVLLNRVRNPKFPNTIPGVVYQPGAFESVNNGLIWARSPSNEAIRAAQAALNGWDPSYGSLFFWNPSKPVSPWIWTRKIIQRIGRHVFGI